MAAQIDVYRDWLGIKDTARPLNYYQLLRLPKFEDDPGKVRAHYRKMNAHVRKFASGDYASESQALLNELAKAMLCLTDINRKREYDASLGRTQEAEGLARSIEEILLVRHIIDQDQLGRARSYASAVGLDIHEALIQQKTVAPEAAMMAYAESLGLPYLDLSDIEVDRRLLKRTPTALPRQHSCVPVLVEGGEVLVASPHPLVPEVEENLRLLLGMPVRTVLCTAGAANQLVAEHFPRDRVGPPMGSRPKAAAKPSAPAAPPKPAREKVYLTREEKFRRRAMFGMIAFNLTVILLMVFFTYYRGGMPFVAAGDFFIAVVGAFTAAAATFGITAWWDG